MLYRLHNDAVTYKPIEASDPYEAIRLMRQEQWENAQIIWLQVSIDGNWRWVAPREKIRHILQAIVDCYGVGTRDPNKLLENLGHFIMEGKQVLDELKMIEKTAMTPSLNNRASIDISKQNLTGQLPGAPVFRLIVWEIETVYGKECRTVFDIAVFDGLFRNRNAVKWLRQLRDRGFNPLEVFVEY